MDSNLFVTPKREVYCHFCKIAGEHRSFECPVYKTVASRKERLGSVCYICLKKNHFSSQCPTRGKFVCFTCKSEKHNSSLCPEAEMNSKRKKVHEPKGSLTASQRKTEPAAKETVQVTVDPVIQQAYQQAESEFTSLCEGNEDVAMQTVVTTVRNPETLSEVMASVLLDSGSKRTYISERVAKCLQLSARNFRNLGICTFSTNSTKKIQAGVTDFEIKGKNNSFISLTGNVVKTITSTVSMGSIPLSAEDQKCVKHLKMGDPHFNKTRLFDVDVLIGNDFYPVLLETEKLKLKASGVILLDTKLGWVTSGVMYGKPITDDMGNTENLALFMNERKPVVLEEDPYSLLPVEELWKFETIGIKDPTECEKADDLALQQFCDTVKFEDGRVSVRWLKKLDCSNLPTNFPVALRRLNSLLKALSKNKEYLEKVYKVFRGTVTKGSN